MPRRRDTAWSRRTGAGSIRPSAKSISPATHEVCFPPTAWCSRFPHVHTIFLSTCTILTSCAMLCIATMCRKDAFAITRFQRWGMAPACRTDNMRKRCRFPEVIRRHAQQLVWRTPIARATSLIRRQREHTLNTNVRGKLPKFEYPVALCTWS